MDGSEICSQSEEDMYYVIGNEEEGGIDDSFKAYGMKIWVNGKTIY